MSPQLGRTSQDNAGSRKSPQDHLSKLTPEERALRARVAAHTSWAKTGDRSKRTAPARAALDAKFLAEADGDPIRAEHLRKAYFGALALKSAIARRKAKELISEAEAAEAEITDEAS